MILYAYVVMSNHVHLAVQSEEGKLSALIRDFKKFTAKTILEKILSEPESRKEWMLDRFKKQPTVSSKSGDFAQRDSSGLHASRSGLMVITY